MSEIVGTDLQGPYCVLCQNRLQERENGPKKDESAGKVKMEGKLKADIENITYSKPQTAGKKTKQAQPVEAIKRPLNVDSSNNIFYINYKGQNKTIRIGPGEYNLLELQNAIQVKVNESFGIGKVRVDLTGSGSDRLVQARDSKIFDSLK